MGKFFKATGSVALYIGMMFISIMPLVILDLPWWGNVIYYALLSFGLAMVAFPVMMVWAFVVEIQQATHDWFGIAFLVVFAVSALWFIISLFGKK